MWMIEGEWSGYTSSQAHVVHREYCSKKRAEKVKAIGHGIQYTDGTMLFLSVREVRGRKLPTILGYRELIDDCTHYGVSSVLALCTAREEAKAKALAERGKP